MNPLTKKGNMRKILLLVLLAWGMLAQAQNSGLSFKKHALGVTVSNDVTSIFRNYDIQDGQQFRVQYGYAAALLYQYRPLKWLSIESGIEWNSTAFFLDDDYPWRFFHTMECHSLGCLQTAEHGMRANRIAIPVNIRGHYQIKRLSLYALAGITLNSTVSGTYFYDENHKEKGWYNFKERGFAESFGLGMSAAIGIEYLLTDKIVLRAEPRFRVYDIVSPYRNGSWQGFIIEYPWAMGLNLGVSYQLGK